MRRGSRSFTLFCCGYLGKVNDVDSRTGTAAPAERRVITAGGILIEDDDDHTFHGERLEQHQDAGPPLTIPA